MGDTLVQICLNIISVPEAYIPIPYLDPCLTIGVHGAGCNGDPAVNVIGPWVNGGHGIPNITTCASTYTVIKNYLCSISSGVK